MMPFEKCLKYGPSVLSDKELLMIFIRSGNAGNSCEDIAEYMLSVNSGEGILGLFNMSVKELMKIKGIGEVKAVQLSSMLELSRRIRQASLINRTSFTDPTSVAEYYMEEMRYLKREMTKVLFLDTKGGLIKDFDLSMGTVNSSLVSPREIFIEALAADAVNIILLHNHPSGDPTPSRDDIDVTKRVKRSGDILGIKLLDHIIIGDKKFVSLNVMGYIN